MQNNNNNINVCRLCLKLVRSAHVRVINEVMRDMLRLLLIKLDLDVSEHPVVCDTCSNVLDEIYLFKSKCLYTEDIISAHVETNSKVSLRDILIEMENKCIVQMDEAEVVCRLCTKIPLNGNYIALGETGDGISFVRDMIQIHLPEMDLSIIAKPIICEVCHVQLKNYASFVTNCMAVEEKIQLYCDLKKFSGPVDLACVLQSMDDKALDLQNRLDKDLIIKQEDDSVMIKVENVQEAEDYILEDNLVGSSSPSELYLKNEEIEIKSENDKMSEEMEESVPTVAPNNSKNSGTLKRKGEIRKSPSKGRKYLSSDDHRGRIKTFGCRECAFETDRSEDKSEVEMRKCENCEFETKHKRSLKRHVMAKHRDRERKFKCDKCTYDTDFKSDLRKHNLGHNGKLKVNTQQKVEMHKCAICEFQTRHKASLYQHMIVHRDPLAERKFKCDQCPFETDYKTSIYQHNLTHKDKSEVEMYKCANCEFETKQKRYLIPHMVKHRDPKAERKFKCDTCPYGSDFKYILRMHNLTHKDKSEVEMHKCVNCEYETKQKRNLLRHVARKHRDPEAEGKF